MEKPNRTKGNVGYTHTYASKTLKDWFCDYKMKKHSDDIVGTGPHRFRIDYEDTAELGEHLAFLQNLNLPPILQEEIRGDFFKLHLYVHIDCHNKGV